MARHFTVTLTSGTNIGPYTIYHTSSTNGNQALLYGTTNQATNLTLAQVQGGVLITVPDNATSVIFYNTNSLLIKNCPTNIVEYPLTPSGTPVATPPPTYGSTPQPTPDATPVATPPPTYGETPQPTPDATPVATPPPTYGETPQPTPDATPVATPNATPNATPAPSALPYSTFFRSTVKSNLGSDIIIDENGNPGGFCDDSYLVNTRFYVGGADRNLHSSLQNQNVYTDANFTNPLPDGYYYCSNISEETGGTTYTAIPGNTHKFIQVQFGIGRVTTGVHNCTNSDPGGNDN